MITRYVDTGSTAGGDGTTNSLAGANRAFVSLRAALDSLPGTLTDAVTIVCAATGGNADTTICNQAAWDFVTSPTNRLTVTVAEGHRHDGKYNTSKYRLEITNPSSGLIYNNIGAHVTLEWLQGQVTVSTSAGTNYSVFRLRTANNNVSNGAPDHYFKQCIAKVVISGGATDNCIGFNDSNGGVDGTVRRINCIAHGGYAGFGSDADTDAPVENYNCTAYGNEFNYLDVQKCVNCLSANATGGAGGFLSTGSTGHSNNAADDTSASGTNARDNQTFTFANAAGGDFHLQASDTGAKDFGLADPLSGVYSIDIDGQTRSGSWDIGADEVVSGVTIGPAQGALALVGGGVSMGFAILMPDEL